MGVTNALYNFGFEYNNPNKPYDLDGFVNSDEQLLGSNIIKRYMIAVLPQAHQTGICLKI